MTPCTICGRPTAGWDDDDEAVCWWCHQANLAGAELRPPASVTRRWRRLLRRGPVRGAAANDEGRT